MPRPKDDVERPNRIEIRLSDDELDMLTRLRRSVERTAFGRRAETQAEVLRRLIRDAAKRR